MRGGIVITVGLHRFKKTIKIKKNVTTNNIDIVNYCRAQFEFDLPSTVVEKHSKKFVAKYRSIM